MKSKSKILGATLSLLFIIGLLAPVAKAQTPTDYMSAQEVLDYVGFQTALNKPVADVFTASMVLGEGVQFYSDGSYKFDLSLQNEYEEVYRATFMSLPPGSNDPNIVNQIMMGTLTPQQIEEIMNGGYDGHVGYYYHMLGEWCGFVNYNNPWDDGGGNHDIE